MEDINPHTGCDVQGILVRLDQNFNYIRYSVNKIKMSHFSTSASHGPHFGLISCAQSWVMDIDTFPGRGIAIIDPKRCFPHDLDRLTIQRRRAGYWTRPSPGPRRALYSALADGLQLPKAKPGPTSFKPPISGPCFGSPWPPSCTDPENWPFLRKVVFQPQLEGRYVSWKTLFCT